MATKLEGGGGLQAFVFAPPLLNYSKCTPLLAPQIQFLNKFLISLYGDFLVLILVIWGITTR